MFMDNRVIQSVARTSVLELTACLSSLLTLELISPGREFYLISPWISDVPLLDARAGRLRPLFSEAPSRVSLAEVLNELAARGTAVRIFCRPHHTQTETFMGRLVPEIAVRQIETLHEKGMITATFYLRGSMNFTYAGVNLNDEHVELTTDSAIVALAMESARLRWEEAGL